MIDSVKPTETTGVLGDGAHCPGNGNLVMVRKAIREGWPIEDEDRAAVIQQMRKVLESGTERARAAAAKVLVACDASNIKRAELELKVDERDNPQAKRHEVLTVNIELTAEEREKHRQAALEALTAKLTGTNGHTNGHHQLPERPE